MKWLCSIALVASIVGCGSNTAEVQMPSAEAARDALDAALATWQDGQPPAAVPDQTPRVQLVDSMRKPGQRLVGYEILGEVGSTDRRAFLVQLRLDQPQEAAKVRFCIVGIDPLWVFREEELDMLGRWACNSPEDAAQKDTAPTNTVSADTAPQSSAPPSEKTAP